jgi:predicted Zn-dependent protease
VGVIVGLVVMSLTFAGCAGLARPADDRAISARAESEEAALAKRVKAYDDPRLAEYLASLTGRLLPGRVDALRITVIEDPTVAAFTLPNGRLYIHTGLLSRVENEAQLATILARELAHYTNGHPRGAVGASGLPAPAMTGPLPRGDLSPTAAAILGLDLRLTAAAAIGGYGASREREADAEGLRRLTRAGYDGEQALKIFERLAGGSPDGGPLEIFFYGNRPRMGERYEAIRELLRATEPPRAAASGESGGGPTFEQRLRPVVRDNAALDIRAGRFSLAQEQLDRVLARTPRDPIAQVYYGDLDRLRSQRAAAAPERAEYARRALTRYQHAVELDPGYAEPFRQLGLLYYQERDTAKARGAFERYLALAPDATDARRIREYLAVVGE